MALKKKFISMISRSNFFCKYIINAYFNYGRNFMHFFEQLLNNYCACLITTKYVKLKNSNQDLIFNALCFAVNAHKTCAKIWTIFLNKNKQINELHSNLINNNLLMLDNNWVDIYTVCTYFYQENVSTKYSCRCFSSFLMQYCYNVNTILNSNWMNIQ